MKFKFHRKAFTLVEALIVIVVIGVLAAMMMMSSDESVSSAKAAAIINNLTEFKIAINSWYTSNFYRVETDGRVRYDGYPVSPIQEIPDEYLQLSKYFSNNVSINLNQSEGHFYQNQNTKMQPGCYGVYDAGKANKTGETDRRTWFVGYAFKDGENKVKQKLNARAESLKLYFTYEADPYDLKKPENVKHYNEEYNLEDRKAIWMYAGIGPAPQWPDGGKLAE